MAAAIRIDINFNRVRTWQDTVEATSSEIEALARELADCVREVLRQYAVT